MILTIGIYGLLRTWVQAVDCLECSKTYGFVTFPTQFLNPPFQPYEYHR